jgi:hypothetical protein
MWRPGGVVVERVGLDFFISYTGVDVAWTRWIAVVLERAGHSTFSQVMDIRPGHDFVHEMQHAVSRAACTIAVLSPAYTGSQFGRRSGGRRSSPTRPAATVG